MINRPNPLIPPLCQGESREANAPAMGLFTRLPWGDEETVFPDEAVMWHSDYF
jgi:hypothetical protein